MKQLLIIAAVLISSIPAYAAQYSVGGSRSCQKWVMTGNGFYPVIESCVVSGVYEASSCKEAFDLLIQHAEDCCPAINGNNRGVYGVTCEVSP